jgi:hypothetical protein
VSQHQVVGAGQALCLVDQLVAEQPPRGRLAVLVDVVEDDLVVLHSPHPPVADLLAGQFLKDQLLVVDDCGLRLRGGDDYGRTRRGQHDRVHRRGRDGVGLLRGRGSLAGDS